MIFHFVRIIDSLNLLRGFFIFLIFTCKKNIVGKVGHKKENLIPINKLALILGKVRKCFESRRRGRLGHGSITETQKFELTEIEPDIKP